MRNRCGALTKSGLWCKAEAVESTAWWRCERHTDWYATATKEDRERLAIYEIEDAIRALATEEGHLGRTTDLDTHRTSPGS